jgi:hypothetical protein
MRSRSFVVICLAVACFSFVTASPREKDVDVRSERRDAVGEDQPDVGQGLEVATLPPVAMTEARTIAAEFVRMHATSGACPNWMAAEVGEATPFYSTAASYPLAYEFPVIKDRVIVGAVLCGATEGAAAVISYMPDGQSIATQLRAAVEAESKRPVAVNARYFYGGASQFGIQVKVASQSDLPVGSETLTVIPEETTILYSFSFVPQTRADWENYFHADFRVSRQWVEAERSVRGDFLAKPANSRVQSSASSKVTVSTGRLAGLPSDFLQETRKWSNGTCPTGCSPLAAAIAFEYWDQHGYPNLIGSDSKNRSHSSASHDDVVAALKELRKGMGTFCNGRVGSTYPISIAKGAESFAKGRGYKKFSADYNVTFRFTKIIGEINAQRPPLLSYEQGPQQEGHTAVPYYYSDSSKDSDDEVCVKSGTPKGNVCYRVNSSTERWQGVTRIRPK